MWYIHFYSRARHFVFSLCFLFLIFTETIIKVLNQQSQVFISHRHLFQPFPASPSLRKGVAKYLTYLMEDFRLPKCDKRKVIITMARSHKLPGWFVDRHSHSGYTWLLTPSFEIDCALWKNQELICFSILSGTPLLTPDQVSQHVINISYLCMGNYQSWELGSGFLYFQSQ